jgi:hypothetical protein
MTLVAQTTLMFRLVGAPDFLGTFEKVMEVDSPAGLVSRVLLPPGLTDYTVPFPGIDVLTTLWVHTDKALLATSGDPTLNEPRTLLANSMIGFANGSLPAINAVTVTYVPEDEADVSFATLTLVWSGYTATPP